MDGGGQAGKPLLAPPLLLPNPVPLWTRALAGGLSSRCQLEGSAPGAAGREISMGQAALAEGLGTGSEAWATGSAQQPPPAGLSWASGDSCSSWPGGVWPGAPAAPRSAPALRPLSSLCPLTPTCTPRSGPCTRAPSEEGAGGGHRQMPQANPVGGRMTPPPQRGQPWGPWTISSHSKRDSRPPTS